MVLMFAGYNGSRCESEKDDCAGVDCGTGGCHDLDDAFECKCRQTDSFGGDRLVLAVQI